MDETWAVHWGAGSREPNPDENVSKNDNEDGRDCDEGEITFDGAEEAAELALAVGRVGRVDLRHGGRLLGPEEGACVRHGAASM